MLLSLYDVDIELKETFVNLLRNNTKIIDKANDWNTLLIKEALLISQKTPELNNGLKASRDLHLF